MTNSYPINTLVKRPSAFPQTRPVCERLNKEPAHQPNRPQQPRKEGADCLILPETHSLGG